MKLYYVNPALLRHLKSNVESFNDGACKENRPFCHVIVKLRNGVDRPFMVPLSSYKPYFEKFPLQPWEMETHDLDEPDHKLSVLRFNNMVPYVPKAVREIKIDELPRGEKALLTKQLKFINAKENAIVRKAINIYKMREFTDSSKRSGTFFRHTASFETLHIYAKSFPTT